MIDESTRPALWIADAYRTRKKLPVAGALAQLRPFVEECTDAIGPDSVDLGTRHPAGLSVATHLVTGAEPPAAHRELCEWAAAQFPPGSFDTEGAGRVSWRARPRGAPMPLDAALGLVGRLEALGPMWARLDFRFQLRDAGGPLPYGDDRRTCGLGVSAHSGKPADITYHLFFPWDAANDRFDALFRRIGKLLKVNPAKLRVEWLNADGKQITRRVPGYD